MIKLSHAVLILAMVSLIGCGGGKPWQEPDPAQSFRTFLMNWTMGKKQRAFDSLVDEDQANIKTAHQSVEGLLKDAKTKPQVHDYFLGSGVATPFGLKKVSLANKLPESIKTGHQAKLLLEFHDGRKGDATMVWDGKRWRVKLDLAG